MTDRDRDALTKAVAVLREVYHKLQKGVDKASFEQEYRGKYVSPGVTVQQYVQQLRLAGNLSEDNGTMKYKK